MRQSRLFSPFVDELLDLNGVVGYSEEDPIHVDADGHRAVALALEPLARRLASAAGVLMQT